MKRSHLIARRGSESFILQCCLATGLFNTSLLVILVLLLSGMLTARWRLVCTAGHAAPDRDVQHQPSILLWFPDCPNVHRNYDHFPYDRFLLECVSVWQQLHYINGIYLILNPKCLWERGLLRTCWRPSFENTIWPVVTNRTTKSGKKTIFSCTVYRVYKWNVW